MVRPRRERRRLSREQQKLVAKLERLTSLAPGGAPDRPLIADTPAIVDMKATADACPICGGTLKLEDHVAEEIDGVRLRVVSVDCTSCHTRRRRYFRLGSAALH